MQDQICQILSGRSSSNLAVFGSMIGSYLTIVLRICSYGLFILVRGWQHLPAKGQNDPAQVHYFWCGAGKAPCPLKPLASGATWPWGLKDPWGLMPLLHGPNLDCVLYIANPCSFPCVWEGMRVQCHLNSHCHLWKLTATLLRMYFHPLK